MRGNLGTFSLCGGGKSVAGEISEPVARKSPFFLGCSTFVERLAIKSWAERKFFKIEVTAEFVSRLLTNCVTNTQSWKYHGDSGSVLAPSAREGQPYKGTAFPVWRVNPVEETEPIGTNQKDTIYERQHHQRISPLHRDRSLRRRR